jgi:hypothetical protein
MCIERAANISSVSAAGVIDSAAFEQHRAQPLGERRAARFAREQHRHSPLTQRALERVRER